MSNTVNGIITWLKGWFYDKTEVNTLLSNVSAGSSRSYFFNENTSAIQTDSNANYFNYKGNGVVRLKGAVIKDYFINTDGWEVIFEYSYPEGLRYTGLNVLADYDNPTNNIGSWEGGSILGLPGDLPSGSSIYDNPKVETWNTLHIRKTSDNTIELWKNNDISNAVSYTWDKLASITKLTIGGKTNSSSPSSYGSVYIRNWNVIQSYTNAYPIGSIYMSVMNINPRLLFGGTWEQLENRFLLGAGSSYTNGSTGGEANHTLTVAEMPSHNHTQSQHRHKEANKYSSGSGSASAYVYSSNRTAVDHYTDYQTPTINNTGGGQAHNNMPPYLVVYMWKRIG